MGSDGTAYIFDEKAFLRCVVPGLNDFVMDGTRQPWLNDVLVRLVESRRLRDVSQVEARGFSFHDICSYFDSSFAFEHHDANQWSRTWDNRACRSTTCPARHVCPLHRSAELSAPEDFTALFEACVVDQSLGEGQFMGRSVSPLWYFDELATMGVNSQDEISDLLGKLEFRGFVVGYRFGNSDGIHGWLYSDETRRFVEALGRLDLPHVEQSFAGMRALSRGAAGYEVPPGSSFKRLSLAFLRTVAKLAVAESKGILWGNDVATTATDSR